jgi:hypothetical protein
VFYHIFRGGRVRERRQEHHWASAAGAAAYRIGPAQRGSEGHLANRASANAKFGLAFLDVEVAFSIVVPLFLGISTKGAQAIQDFGRPGGWQKRAYSKSVSFSKMRPEKSTLRSKRAFANEMLKNRSGPES